MKVFVQICLFFALPMMLSFELMPWISYTLWTTWRGNLLWDGICGPLSFLLMWTPLFISVTILLLLERREEKKYTERMLRGEVPYRLPLKMRRRHRILLTEVPSSWPPLWILRTETFFDKRVGETIQACWFEDTDPNNFIGCG